MIKNPSMELYQWGETSTECRIWLDPANNIYCTLDPEDFEWAVKYTWHAMPDRHKRKFYASRTTRVKGVGVRYYMHKEILERQGLKKRKTQTIGDHLDGDSLNNRRYNLKWATPKQNAKTSKRWK